VISLGGIVTSKAILVVGNTFDERITDYIRKKYNLMIDERTAEEIEFEIGSASEDTEQVDMDIRGRNLLTVLPETLSINNKEIVIAIQEYVEKIVTAVKQTLEIPPPDLSADVMNRGIVLTGGGALLKNIDKVISEETDIPVFITEDPLTSVAVGAGESLKYI